MGIMLGGELGTMDNLSREFSKQIQTVDGLVSAVDAQVNNVQWAVSDASLREGSRVDLATGPTAATTPAALELCVVGGLSGGERFGLDRGTHVIGRQRDCA